MGAYLLKNWAVVALIAALVIGMALPLATGISDPGFYFEVMLGGLMSGVLYSLVALGLVLIFKASGVFNFAQGAMVLGGGGGRGEGAGRRKGGDGEGKREGGGGGGGGREE